MKKTVLLFLLLLFSNYFTAQVVQQKTETGNSAFPKDTASALLKKKITGKWRLVYFKGGIMETDSVSNQLLRLQKTASKKPAAAYTMEFSGDSVSLVKNNKVKYKIDPLKNTLVFILQGTTSTLQQKIYRLAGRFLVLEDCTIDCFTMFYIKE